MLKLALATMLRLSDLRDCMIPMAIDLTRTAQHCIESTYGYRCDVAPRTLDL